MQNKDYIVGVLAKQETELVEKMKNLYDQNPEIPAYLAMQKELETTRMAIKEMQTTVPLVKLAETFEKQIESGAPTIRAHKMDLKIHKDRGEKVGVVFGNAIYRNIVIEMVKIEHPFKAIELLPIIKSFQDVTESLANALPYAYLRFLHDRKVAAKIDSGNKRSLWQISRTKSSLTLNGASDVEKEHFVGMLKQEQDVQPSSELKG